MNAMKKATKTYGGFRQKCGALRHSVSGSRAEHKAVVLGAAFGSAAGHAEDGQRAVAVKSHGINVCRPSQLISVTAAISSGLSTASPSVSNFSDTYLRKFASGKFALLMATPPSAQAAAAKHRERIRQKSRAMAFFSAVCVVCPS